MAPEVIHASKTTPYNELCDIWSVGVIAYLMLTGDMPFHIKDYNHAVERFKEFRQYGEDDEIFRKKRFK